MSNKHHDLLGVPKHANQHRLSRLTMEVHTDELRIMASAVESYTDELIAALEAAEKRIAELEAVKLTLSDSKLLTLAKDIVENLVDTGASDPDYTQQYVDWTCKRIRAAAAGKGEAS